MAQDIISQFRRTYNSPIELYRQVATATDRDNIPSGVRWPGMLCYVVSDDVTYVLVGGISNGDWDELGGLQDAPIDGQLYGRKDGDWSLVPPSGSGIKVFKNLTEYNYSDVGFGYISEVTIEPSDVQAGDIFEVVILGYLTRTSNTVTVNYSLLGANMAAVTWSSGTGTLAFTLRATLYIESLSEGYISAFVKSSGSLANDITQSNTVPIDYTESQETKIQAGAGNVANNINILGHIVKRIRP